VNEFAPNTTRASLEVARVALGRMQGDPPPPNAPRTLPVTMAVRASDAWKGVEQVLRSVTGQKELAGQALLSEARRVDALDMESMHALVALREWVERTLAPGSAAQMLTLAPTEAEKEVAGNALAALERVAGVSGSTPASETDVGFKAPRTADLPPPPLPPVPSPWAQQPASRSSSSGAANRSASPAKSAGPTQPPIASTSESQWGVQFEPSTSSRSSALIMSVIAAVIVLGGAGAWFALKDRGGTTSSATAEGAAAYARGSKEAARLAFVRAVEENPEDVRALTYLGRISRELGNLATARKYLESAIRIDQNNALALREFGSALLADQQPELARRFYVRAVEADPSDRVAQGFLGCALMRLNRTEEARRWMERAGTGEWSACAVPPDAQPPISKD
jgi:tetratricopeptide (TPR) repeat protein